jgi:hypothetical protein
VSAKAYEHFILTFARIGEFSQSSGLLNSSILTLGYAAIPAAEALSQAFSKPFTVQDNARQFLF